MRTTRLIVVILSAILIASGCNKTKRVPIAALPPASPATPATPPTPLPPAKPISPALDEADRAFNSGSYDDAARDYENYLRSDPEGSRRDEALFHMGLAYALRSTADWQRASSAFKQIVEVFPDSPFKPPASLILSLHSELDQVNASVQQRDQRLRQLTTELDRLKKIDADRRKRP